LRAVFYIKFEGNLQKAIAAQDSRTSTLNFRNTDSEEANGRART
jgi:hypothetical protein